jgi:hypothetical protein
MATGWWPQEGADGDDGQFVAVQATSGERWCGALGEARPGALSVPVNDRPVVVSLRDVATVEPVDNC